MSINSIYLIVGIITGVIVIIGTTSSCVLKGMKYLKAISDKVDEMYERGTIRAGREQISDEILEAQSESLWVLLRHADDDPTLNGEVKRSIKRLEMLKEKKLQYDRKVILK